MPAERPPWLAAVAGEPAYSWALRCWDACAAIEGNWFDHDLADAIVELWPRYFRHTEGRWAGKPFALAVWQAIIVRLLVGWKNADGFRFLRRLVLWVGKKNGKSEFIAALSLLFWIFDREMGGQAYAIARNEKQAKIVFEKAKTMLRVSPLLLKKVQIHKKEIFQPEQWARFELLSGNAEGKHGISTSVLAGDEMHEWLDDTLYTTLHQAEAARDQPIELLGSTAGFRNRGYGWTLWEECRAILDGRLHQPSTLVVIFAVPADVDWTDEKFWPLANPNLGISPKLEYLREECAKAKENARRENDFRRYHLNQ
jgi:phage terminase large subunit-like protein